MALDPNIPLQAGQGLAVQPFNPVATLTQIENIKALRDQREALADERRQQAQALIQKAQDTAAVNQALQQTNGDLLGAGDLLTQAGKGTLGQTLIAQHSEQAKKAADALESQNKAAQAHLDMASNVIATMGDSPEHYEAGRQFISQLVQGDGQLKQWFDSVAPQNADPSQIGGIVANLTAATTDAKQRATQQATSVENFLKGDYDTSLSSALLAQPQAGRPQVLAMAAQLAPSKSVRDALLAKWAPIINDDQAIAEAGKKPHEIAEEQNAAATRAQATANAAETARHNRVTEGIQATRAANAAAGQVPGANGEPNDSVKQYADDLLNGRIAITGVPAAGHMRDAVEAYMRQQHFDLSKPLTAQVQARVEFANAVLPQIDAVEAMAKQINDQGLMGTVGGRFRDLASGESSAADLAGLTPMQRQLVGKFVTQADLLASGVAMTHFGARTSGDAVKAMRDRLDPKGKDLDAFLGSLEGARDVLNGYARLTPGSKNATGGKSETWTDADVRVTADGRHIAKNSQGTVVEVVKGPNGWVVKGG